MPPTAVFCLACVVKLSALSSKRDTWILSLYSKPAASGRATLWGHRVAARQEWMGPCNLLYIAPLRRKGRHMGQGSGWILWCSTIRWLLRGEVIILEGAEAETELESNNCVQCSCCIEDILNLRGILQPNIASWSCASCKALSASAEGKIDVATLSI